MIHYNCQSQFTKMAFAQQLFASLVLHLKSGVTP